MNVISKEIEILSVFDKKGTVSQTATDLSNWIQ
jgi:hypothetical protein